MANILVVDDELGIRDLLSEILNDEGHQVEVAENAAQARAARQKERPDLVLLDIWMPDTDGVTLLKEWAASALLTMPVVMMSGHGARQPYIPGRSGGPVPETGWNQIFLPMDTGSWDDRTGTTRNASARRSRTTSRAPATSATVGGSECRHRSVIRTQPISAE
jgi:CheY-like chemotaxis protein